jgi:hypothetical protein
MHCRKVNNDILLLKLRVLLWQRVRSDTTLHLFHDLLACNILAEEMTIRPINHFIINHFVQVTVTNAAYDCTRFFEVLEIPGDKSVSQMCETKELTGAVASSIRFIILSFKKTNFSGSKICSAMCI